MSGSRSTPPLFDLLRQVPKGPASPGASPRPIDAPTPVAPRTSPGTASPAPGPEPAATSTERVRVEPVQPRRVVESAPPPNRSGPLGSLLDAGRRFTLPMTSIYLAIAFFLALLVIVWTVAYRVGGSQRENEINQRFGDVAPPTTTGDGSAAAVKDPLGAGNVAAPEPARPRPVEPPAPRPAVTRPAPATPAPAVARPVEKPNVSTEPVVIQPGADPRTPGLNYLVLASQLSRDDADKVVTYLSQNGLSAAIVPLVDRSGRAANNPARFEVWSLRGMTGEELRQPPADRHRAEIARLGQVFRRENRGLPDFADAYWKKFQP